MTNAETLMEQAGITAKTWLVQAEQAVNELEGSELMGSEAKAQIISAFIAAAAQDQHTMTIRNLAEKGLITGC